MRAWQTRALALTLGFSLALSGSGIQGVPLVKVERASAAENGSQSRASSSTKVTMWNNDTSASLTLPEMKGRTGWTAVGWSKSTAASPDGTLTAGSNTSVSENTTFYGVYKKAMSFKVNGTATTKDVYSNSNSPGVQQTTIKAPSSDPVKDGYTFKGWKEEGGNGMLYPSGSTMVVTGKGDIVAEWEANNYTVEFWDGSEKKGQRTFVYDQAQGLTAASSLGVLKNGYVFLGWSRSNGGEKAFSDGESVKNLTPQKNGTVKLYATRRKCKSKLIVYPVGGVWDGSISQREFTKEFGDAIAVGDPTKTGYTFKGWTLAGDRSGSLSGKNYTFGAMDAATDTLTAQWTANKYTVKFNGNGSTSGSMSDQQFTWDEAKKLSKNGFSRTGYTFQGWQKADGSVVSDEAMVSNWATNGSLTLTAVWAPISYTIELWEGTQKVKVFSIAYDSTKTLDSGASLGLERTGYTFLGWSKSEGASTADFEDCGGVSNLASQSGKVVKLYSVRRINTSSVKVDTAGGKWNHDGKDVEGEKVFSQNYNTDLTLETPTRLGYTFTGWKLTGDKNGAVANKSYVFGAKDATNDVLTAQWTANEYTVHFNGNGKQSGAMRDQQFTYDDAPKALTKNSFRRRSYKFTGWSKDTVAKDFDDQEKVVNLASEDNAVVQQYALWAINHSSLTVNPNGGYWRDPESGTDVQTPKNFYNRESGSELTIADPVWSGHTFKGWEKSENFNGRLNGQTYAFGDADSVEDTLTATWDFNRYSVEFEAGIAGTTGEMESQELKYGIAASLTPCGFKKTGYTFKGWATEKGGAVVYQDRDNVANLAPNDGDVVKLYGVWEVNRYTIEYWSDGEKKGESNLQYDEESALKNRESLSIEKTGHTFLGWSRSVGGEKEFSDADVVSKLDATNGATVRLYAVWSKNSSGLTVYPEGGDWNWNGTVSNDTVTVKKGYGDTVTIDDPERKGYTFVNWSKSDPFNGTLDGKNYTFGPSKDAADAITAQWKANTYTIELQNSDGAVVDTVEATWDQSVQLKSVAELDVNKLGYRFGSWSTKIKGVQTYFDDGATVSNLEASNGGKVILKAVMVAIPYTIKFNGNGETSGSMKSITADYDSTVSLPKCGFEKLGHTFSGWECLGQKYKDEQRVQNLCATGSAVVMTAEWSINHSTVTVDPNGGVWVNGDESYKEPKSYEQEYSSILSLAAPSREGYEFKGWVLDGDKNGTLTDKIYRFGSADGAKDTLTASWAKNPYKIVFDSNGASTGAMDPMSLEYDQSANLDKCKFKKEGYTFLGWAKKIDATEPEYSDEQSVHNLASEAGAMVVLYAVWKANHYTIKFDNNGAEGSVDDLTLAYDQREQLPKCSLSKIGFDFAGWSVTPKGDAKFNDESVVSNLASEDGSSITLYAVWSPYTSKLTIDPVRGSIAINGVSNNSAKTLAQKYKEKVTIANPVGEGYQFKGWKQSYDESKATKFNGVWNGGTYTFGRVKDAEDTLTAEWEPNKYKVEYWDGSKSVGDSELSYDKDSNLKTISELKVKKAGYVFSGWAAEPTGKVKYIDGGTVKNLTTKANGVVKLYAVWSKDSYKVIYNNNGSYVGDSVFNFEESVKLKTAKTLKLEKQGYTFDGWATTADGSVKYKDGQEIRNLAQDSKEVNLYAVWSANKYSIEYCSDSKTIGTSELRYDKESDLKTLKELNAEKSGYTFMGWSTEEGTAVKFEDGSSVKNLTTVADGTVKLYAVWERNKYVLEYCSDNRVIGTVNCTYSVDFKLKNPLDFGIEQVGYSFDGWSTSPDGDVKYQAGDTVSDLTAKADETVKLYAVWSINHYTIEYWDGDTKKGESELEYGKKAKLKSVADLGIERSGYDFANWSSGNQTFTDGQEVENLATNGVVKLYAIWKPAQYKVIFSTGVAKDVTDEVNTDASLTLDSNSLKQDLAGYTIKGWNLQGTDVVYKDRSSLSNTEVRDAIVKYGEPLKFDLIKTPIKYTIKYTNTGGSNPTSYTVEDQVTLKNPKKAGYTFKGWLGTGLTGPTTKVVIPKGSTGDRSYRCYWVKKQSAKKSTTAKNGSMSHKNTNRGSGSGYSNSSGNSSNSGYSNGSSSSNSSSSGSSNSGYSSGSSNKGNSGYGYSRGSSNSGYGNVSGSGSSNSSLDSDEDDDSWDTTVEHWGGKYVASDSLDGDSTDYYESDSEEKTSLINGQDEQSGSDAESDGQSSVGGNSSVNGQNSSSSTELTNSTASSPKGNVRILIIGLLPVIILLIIVIVIIIWRKKRK